MTIDEMSPEEINEKVALKLGAMKLKECNCGDPYDDHWELTHEWNYRKFVKRLPDYCRDILAAWEVVKYLRTQPLRVLFLFVVVLKHEPPIGDDPLMWFIEKGSPRDICLAFLKLKE